MHRNARPAWLAVCFAGLVACGEREGPAPREPGSELVGETGAGAFCDESAARTAVTDFGEALSRVSLLVPDSMIAQQVRQEYAPFVTRELLERWTMDPASAPGRNVSSPWPHRIEITSVSPGAEGGCRVQGEVVYVTSMELAYGGAAAHVPVSLQVVNADGWKIATYQAETPFEPGELPDIAAATDVIRRYYAAIGARDYATAYDLWGDNGAASGQQLEEFIAGFAETATVDVDVGEPSGIEPAAGSRYVSVPVVIRASTNAGQAQRFEGTYTLRQSVADGATIRERQWLIYSADIRQVQ